MDENFRQLIRNRYLRPRTHTLQELCKCCLISSSSLYRWKQLTGSLPDSFCRNISVLSSEYFSGCSVDFCLQWSFTKHGLPSYRVKCSLDQQRYLAIRTAMNPDTVRVNDELWHWSRLNHDNLLSVLAVAVSIDRVFLITALPEDSLVQFAGFLGSRTACVRERFLWKFLRQLCSVLRYLDLEGVSVKEFDAGNVYLLNSNILINNGLAWKTRMCDPESLPGALWKLLFGTECLSFLEDREGTAFSVGLVMSQLVALALARPVRDQRAQQITSLHGVELAAAPQVYSDEFLKVVARVFLTPPLTLDVVEKKAANVLSALASEESQYHGSS